jgi:FtsP/CotA-like multicopper oxidase with cupredoxin domain
MDAHPIHVHLVQFQIVRRQTFNAASYLAEWTRLNGDLPFNHSTVNVAAFNSYLTGTPTAPSANEQGWKDTIIANSGEVTVIRLRFAQQNGDDFPFDATAGPGYVWHCHLLEHEDNEMMRPYTVAPKAGTENPELIIIAVAVVIAVAVIGFIGYVRFRKRSR